jgi:osmoprotectant transport system permease protein
VTALVAAPPTSWQWIWDHRDDIGRFFLQHVQLTAIAVAVGLVISVPLALLAYRFGVTYGPITGFTGLLCPPSLPGSAWRR